MGAVGEDEAERFLASRGYRIVERNFSCRSGEIDLVADDDGTLCFVEIKARAGEQYGSAIESLSRTKLRKLVRAAQWYLTLHPTDAPCRFDVLAMDLDPSDRSWRFQLVRGAFDAGV